MAKRPPIIAKKVKKTPTTRGNSFIIDRQYLGDEPVFDAMTDSQYGKALNWYNYMCDVNDAREYITEYLTKRNRTAESKLLAKLDNCWVPTTVAWRCRMIDRNPQISFDNDYLEKTLATALARVTKAEAINANTVVITAQDRIRERQHEIIGEIEALLDTDPSTIPLYDWLKEQDIPASYCTGIIAKYQPWLDELIVAAKGTDIELKEAYSHMTKKELKTRIAVFTKLIDDANRYSDVIKKVRAPRKPRAVSIEKKLKHVKCQKEDNTFKIASINPEKIIGAQELWTFNTKYKVITVFRANGPEGLQVNRTAITGYDEATSISKGTGRKTQIVLDKLKAGGKVTLRKLMDDLKTDKPLQVRINENTILLKAVM